MAVKTRQKFRKMKKGKIVLTKREDKMTRSFRASVDRAIKRKQSNNKPVARYDVVSHRAYLEYPDGTKQYINVG